MFWVFRLRFFVFRASGGFCFLCVLAVSVFSFFPVFGFSSWFFLYVWQFLCFVFVNGMVDGKVMSEQSQYAIVVELFCETKSVIFVGQ